MTIPTRPTSSSNEIAFGMTHCGFSGNGRRAHHIGRRPASWAGLQHGPESRLPSEIRVVHGRAKYGRDISQWESSRGLPTQLASRPCIPQRRGANAAAGTGRAGDASLRSLQRESLVTTLLSPRDSKFHCFKADEARAKESKSLESRKWVRWETLITLDQFEEEKRTGTWSLAQVLTSEKHTEMGCRMKTVY